MTTLTKNGHEWYYSDNNINQTETDFYTWLEKNPPKIKDSFQVDLSSFLDYKGFDFSYDFVNNKTKEALTEIYKTFSKALNLKSSPAATTLERIKVMHLLQDELKRESTIETSLNNAKKVLMTSNKLEDLKDYKSAYKKLEDCRCLIKTLLNQID